MHLCLLPLLALGFPNTFPQVESVSCDSFSCNLLLLFWSPIGMVKKYGERKKFYNFQIKSQSLSDPESLRCGIYQHFSK